jgi:hypothetical protein
MKKKIKISKNTCNNVWSRLLIVCFWSLVLIFIEDSIEGIGNSIGRKLVGLIIEGISDGVPNKGKDDVRIFKFTF